MIVKFIFYIEDFKARNLQIVFLQKPQFILQNNQSRLLGQTMQDRTVPFETEDFLAHMRRANGSFRLLKRSTAGDRAFDGHYGHEKLRDGLSVLHSDTLSLCEMETECELPPHLSIKLFFAGNVEAKLADHKLPMPTRPDSRRDWEPVGVVCAQNEPVRFWRRVKKGDRIRKFNISILPEWLASGDVFRDQSAAAIAAFSQTHLALSRWRPSPAAIAFAEQAMRGPVAEPHLHRLQVESCVLMIIAEAFHALGGENLARITRARLSPSESIKLGRAEEMIVEAYGHLPGVEELAAHAGVSANTLQRLFHAAHGMTVFHYMRKTKLEQARILLNRGEVTIAQAAFTAGYSSTANFSTAFRRHFGFPPGKIG
ncbi:helix-turn-helix transcriptional regulator [Martelella alba]|uniref:Helix-turn-helix transcriptional regulator n=1 Tax=Martelella alba TaxID=2590451 RepID=A0A506UDQ1_9HYPH|nr:AraC family transcriptional regulator [Martelella alba]TPW31526.1 helix-turn-helix transcriptional regulator [Martelella alba]